VNEKLDLPLNHDDVLKTVRRSRELGMTDNAIAAALRISVAHLHDFILQHGTLKEAMDVVKALRTPTP